MAKPLTPAVSLMPLAVRWYLWLDGRWAVPWLTPEAMPSARRPASPLVDGRVRLAQDERQFNRVGEGRPAEDVELLFMG